MQTTTERKITVIPKKEAMKIDLDTGIVKKKRVCAYARVSTDLEDQKNSFIAQREYYSYVIKNNPDWEFVDLYSDEGLSGTSIKKRDGFKRMMDDALGGKIDLILVKSISRFARNTVDCLSVIRELRDKGITVIFEKENLSTDDTSIELALTIFASMAQEESKSISENVKWGIRKRMQKGVTHVHTDNLLGFDRDQDNKIVINEVEAEIVKTIYNLYIAGYSYRKIIEHLKAMKYLNGKKQAEWTINNINRILSDEKYCGLVILQKTVTKDFLSHKQLKNDGLEQQYVIENHHEGIISKEDFEYVKMLRKRNSDASNFRYEACASPFAGIFFCRDCHRPMVKISTHPGTIYKRIIYTCKNTSKKNVNYIKCNAKNSIDYELAMMAGSDVFNRFFVKKNKLNALIAKTYVKEDRAKIYYKKVTGVKEKISKLEIEIKSLVKKQMECESMDRFEKEFKFLKVKLESYKDELKRIEDSEFESLNTARAIEDIKSYIDGKAELPYAGFHELIKAVIKTDDELVFILKDTSTEGIDIFDEFGNYTTLYSGSVSRTKYCLNYRVVTLGGNHNEN